MDTQIINWEMNADSDSAVDLKEEIALWPSEPYTLNWNTINWN
jgi:hypothetical protein